MKDEDMNKATKTFEEVATELAIRNAQVRLMVYVDELKAKGYLQLMDPLWDDCLIIPREEFTNEIAICLRVEGLRYHFSRLDNYAAVFVELQPSSFTDQKAAVPFLEVNC